MKRRRLQFRSGQSLVEFAVVALVMYMLLAAIITFGHLLYVAQGLQSAADLAAREISRTRLGATLDFQEALDDQAVIDHIYDPGKLVYVSKPDEKFFDVIRGWPLLNQQLAPLMIVDGPYIRYPGALLDYPNSESGFTVGIPMVESRDGGETITWLPVVEEIAEADAVSPFSVLSDQGGIVALRINYPFQSAAMSSFQPNVDGEFEPTVGQPNLATGTVTETNPSERPGALIVRPLVAGGVSTGTYGGTYGMGSQQALGQTVRPYRRVISAQAIYRREIFE